MKIDAVQKKMEWISILRQASKILNAYWDLERRVEEAGHGKKLESLFITSGLLNLMFSAVRKLKRAGLSDSDIKELRELISTIENISAASNVMKDIGKLLEDNSEQFVATVSASSAKDCETLLDETVKVGNAIDAFEERKEREKQIQKN